MASAKDIKTVLLAGRLNGPKGEVALGIIENVFIPLAHGTGIRFVIAGGPVSSRHSELSRLHPAFEFLGFRSDIQNFYRDADIVIGAGRVAFEAMAAGRPVLAIGHHAYCGPALKKNERRILETNAGDFAQEKEHDFDGLRSDLGQMLRDARLLQRVAAEGKLIAQTHFATSRVAKQVEEKYRTAILAANRERFEDLRIVFSETEIGKNETPILPSSLNTGRLPENPVLLCHIGLEAGLNTRHVRFLKSAELAAARSVPAAEIGLCIEEYSTLRGEGYRIKNALRRLAPGQEKFPLLIERPCDRIPDSLDVDFSPVIRRRDMLNAKYLLEVP